MRLRRVTFRQSVPVPGKPSEYVESLQSHSPALKTYCAELELQDGFVWVGLHGYPLSVVSHIERDQADAVFAALDEMQSIPLGPAVASVPSKPLHKATPRKRR